MFLNFRTRSHVRTHSLLRTGELCRPTRDGGYRGMDLTCVRFRARCRQLGTPSSHPRPLESAPACCRRGTGTRALSGFLRASRSSGLSHQRPSTTASACLWRAAHGPMWGMSRLISMSGWSPNEKAICVLLVLQGSAPLQCHSFVASSGCKVEVGAVDAQPVVGWPSDMRTAQVSRPVACLRPKQSGGVEPLT